MFTLIIAILVIGFLILVHELGHFMVAKAHKVRVETFSLGFGPRLFGWSRGGTEYIVCAVPLGGYVKMAGEEAGEKKSGARDEFMSQTPWTRMQIIAAGPLMNVLLTYVLLFLLLCTGIQVAAPCVGSLMDGYPAKAAGLQPGDQIRAISGQAVKQWADMTDLISASQGRPLLFTIDRNGQTLEVPITPKTEETRNIFGNPIRACMIGITPGDSFVIERHAVLPSIALAGEKTWDLLDLTYRMLGAIVMGKVSAKNIGGPLLIAQMAGKQAKAGLPSLLSFMALISINLAALNLLPIPVLDGGHLLFLLLEFVRRKPISERVQEWAQKVCFALLILLMVFASYNDLLRIFHR